MIPEEWRPIAGYEGRYEVSSCGFVRSLDRLSRTKHGTMQPVPGRQLKMFIRRRYLSVALYEERRRDQRMVHTLVCETFHGPRPSPVHQVRHLNGDRTDNRAANLTWGTRSENQLDMVRHGTHNMARKTRCSRGHEYTPENTLRRRGERRGERECRTCHSELRRTQMDPRACPGSYSKPQSSPVNGIKAFWPVGHCPECSGLYQIRRDGTLRKHQRPTVAALDKAGCL